MISRDGSHLDCLSASLHFFAAMSDSMRNVMKGGWHPKGKDGGKESWRGDFKGINQVVWVLLAI